MDILTGLTCIALTYRSSVGIQPAPLLRDAPPAAIARTPKAATPNRTLAPMSATVQLRPYEISAGTATSYADVSLTLLNASSTATNIEVSQIAILTPDGKRVLLQVTPDAVNGRRKVILKPGDRTVITYRLQTPTQIYRRDQPVTAQIRYRQDQRPEQAVQSSPEAVAFMIP